VVLLANTVALLYASLVVDGLCVPWVSSRLQWPPTFHRWALQQHITIERGVKGVSTGVVGLVVMLGEGAGMLHRD